MFQAIIRRGRLYIRDKLKRFPLLDVSLPQNFHINYFIFTEMFLGEKEMHERHRIVIACKYFPDTEI